MDVSAGGAQIYAGTGTLLTSVNMPGFSAELNRYLSSCTPDGQGYCDAPLTFEFAGAGNLSVSELSITYDLPGAKAQATVTNEGLKNTTLKNFWFATTTGDIHKLNSEEIHLAVGDMYIGKNTACAFICNTFAAVRATTTCGSSAEFTGTPTRC